jgi:hypothetical protein
MLEDALQATSRCALTTIFAILEACKSFLIIIAKVNAELNRHAGRV